MRAFKKYQNRGFTLIELMIVVAIVGVLAALAVYGVSKYLATAKTAEAKNSLGAIGKGAAAAYEREWGPPGAPIMGPGTQAAFSHQLCDSEAALVPALASVKGVKYQSKAADWNVGAPANVGFACVKFTMDQPQYYAYGYTAKNITNRDTATFAATAQGDLNGDGVPSTFTLNGGVQNGVATVAPAIDEASPEE